MAARDLYTERTNLWTLIIALLVTFLGFVLLVVADNWQWLAARSGTQSVIREMGGLLIPAGLITVLWELRARRAFLDELTEIMQETMAESSRTKELQAAGIVGFTMDFQHGIDWPGLLRTANSVDMHFVYARTWRGSLAADLRALARRNATVRVVLPDPNDERLMQELAVRFGRTADKWQALILEAEDDLRRIFGPDSVAEFSLWYLPATLVYSFYRFDRIAVISMYKYEPERGEIPTLTVEEGGALYRFITEEIELLTKPDGRARQVYPIPNGPRRDHEPFTSRS